MIAMTNDPVIDTKMTTAMIQQTIQTTAMSTDATARTESGTATARRDGTTGGRREKTERTRTGERTRGMRRLGSEFDIRSGGLVHSIFSLYTSSSNLQCRS